MFERQQEVIGNFRHQNSQLLDSKRELLDSYKAQKLENERLKAEFDRLIREHQRLTQTAQEIRIQVQETTAECQSEKEAKKRFMDRVRSLKVELDVAKREVVDLKQGRHAEILQKEREWQEKEADYRKQIKDGEAELHRRFEEFTAQQTDWEAKFEVKDRVLQEWARGLQPTMDGLRNDVARMQRTIDDLQGEVILCTVCMERPRSVLFDACRHVVCCRECAQQRRRGGTDTFACTMCPAPTSISGVILS